ncbi:hypothetical protein QF026_002068 [Streptomyces aurantiacus]|nr:hypothetical protein [Streptomyces aurantiacus]
MFMRFMQEPAEREPSEARSTSKDVVRRARPAVRRCGLGDQMDIPTLAGLRATASMPGVIGYVFVLR